MSAEADRIRNRNVIKRKEDEKQQELRAVCASISREEYGQQQAQQRAERERRDFSGIANSLADGEELGVRAVVGDAAASKWCPRSVRQKLLRPRRGKKKH